MLIDILLMVGGISLLTVGGNWLLKGASALATSLGVSTFVIGLTVVAMGTSAPEASLAIASSLKGDPSISFGDVIGSNVANIGVVLAIPCLLYPLSTRMTLFKREAVFLVVSIATIAVLGYNQIIDQGNALVLITIWIAFNYFIFRTAKFERTARLLEVKAEGATMGRWMALAFTLGGLVTLIGGSELVLNGGVGMAQKLGVDEFIIGATMVAVGTSLPELVVCVTSLRRGETGLILGNIMGSNISNSLLIVGLAGMFSPITMPGDFYTLALPVTLIIYGVLIGFMYKNRKLDRLTGIALISLFVLYMTLILF
ncbi:MAG: calcium/sodium antiporter [Euryarchaeota archaeon]|nr:calcium/sodium antiporter [Euryarchaeota archaeon]